MTVQNHIPRIPESALFMGLIILFFIAIIPTARGYTFERAMVSDELFEDYSLHETLDLTVLNNSADSFEFTLPKGAYEVTLNSVPVSQSNNSIMIPLDCLDCRFTVSYKLDKVSTKEGTSRYSFSRTLNFPKSPAVLEYSVYLPAGYIVDLASQEPPIVPSSSQIDTDGQDIIVRWSYSKPELPQRFYIKYMTSESVGFSDIKQELGESPVLVIAFMAFMIGGIAGFALMKAKKPIPQVPASVLTPDEKAVIELIRQNGMKMNQKDVVKGLNWSKSKVSAVMTNLESKKMIEREKFGRNYKVTLVRDVG
jgi:uncharacterized membrane protein